MGKLIKVSDTKAFRVEGIKIGGKKMVSIRQMYATKKDPKFKPARQGVTLALEDKVVQRVFNAVKSVVIDGEFKTIDTED